MALNLANLTVVRDVEVPRANRGRPASENPLLTLVQESNDKRTAGQVPGMALPNVPASEVREVYNYLRYAANSLNIGMRIYSTTADGNDRIVELGRKEDENGNATGLDIVYKDETGTAYTGNVNILFEAAKRRERKADSNGETVSDSVEDATEPDDSEDETNDVTEEADTEVTELAETPKPARNRRK